MPTLTRTSLGSSVLLTSGNAISSFYFFIPRDASNFIQLTGSQSHASTALVWSVNSSHSCVCGPFVNLSLFELCGASSVFCGMLIDSAVF